MKIIQIVTLITPDGAYGGPVRVALNQCKSLMAAGHDVVLVAAHRGFSGPPPTEIEGVEVKLFTALTIVPFTGFAGITSPGLLAWLKANGPVADAVHIHLARDLVTLPSALIAFASGRPFHVQTHGMIDESERLLAKILDRLITCRVLRTANSVFYLTEAEKSSLISVAGNSLALRFLVNGVPKAAERAHPEISNQVLFLARLHRRKRPSFFAKMGVELSSIHVGIRFLMVGPDEGEGALVGEIIRDVQNVEWIGSVAPDETLSRMARASIYVLPSIDEPFPMSVLEAMSIGLPVIVSETCGLAESVRSSGAGIVVDHSYEALVEATSKLISSPTSRLMMGIAGRKLVRREYSMNRILDHLIQAYDMPS